MDIELHMISFGNGRRRRRFTLDEKDGLVLAHRIEGDGMLVVAACREYGVMRRGYPCGAGSI